MVRVPSCQSVPLVFIPRVSSLVVKRMPFCKGSQKRQHESHLPETEGGTNARREPPSSRASLRGGVGISLLWSLLCAPLITRAETVDEEPPVAAMLDAATPRERLDEAWRRIDLRDFEGARLLVPSFREAFPVDALYLHGVSFQLERRHDEALADFSTLIATWPEHARAIDARFRVALTLADAGRPDEALRALTAVGRWRDLEGEAAWKLQLCEATWTFEAGRLGLGLRRIEQALEAVPAEALTWFQARARSALLHHAALASEALHFDVPEGRVKRRLDARAVYVKTAEQQLTELASLPEPYFILHGLLDLGDAMRDLGDDLRTARVPARLTAEQREVYDRGVRDKAVVQYVKARRYYDLGIEHAGRVHWSGPELDLLRARLAEVDAIVEAD
jgi:tetratricopeptide (TPR) repeat protein